MAEPHISGYYDQPKKKQNVDVDEGGQDSNHADIDVGVADALNHIV